MKVEEPYGVNSVHSQQVQPLGLCSSFVWLQLVLLHLSTIELLDTNFILNGSSECDLFV